MDHTKTDGIRPFSSLRSPNFDKFMIEAAKNLDAKRAATRKEVGIARWADVTLEISRRISRFTTPDGRTLEASVLVLGSYDSAEGTWEWGWNNPYLPEDLRRDSIRVKHFGEIRGWTPLTEGILSVSTNGVWGLISVAVEVLGARGAQNGTFESLDVVVAYHDLVPLATR